MSHFTCAVFSKTKDDVERLLAPYDERIVVAPYIKYTKAQAIEEAKKWTDPEKTKGWTDEQFYNIEAEPYANDDMIDEQWNLLSTYNPNSKWDYWQNDSKWIREAILLKGGSRSNGVKVRDVKFAPDRQAYEKAIKFWNDYVLGTPEVRAEMCKKDFLFRHEWYLEQFETAENYAKVQSTFHTYAFVEANGIWHQTGEMG